MAYSSIRKRGWTSNGKDQSAWVVDYFDQAGKRRLKTFATKKAAEEWSVTARHEVRTGIHSPASISITVAECGALWLDHCDAEGLEISTIRQRKQHLNLHIGPVLGRAKLSALTTPAIHQFDADLRAAGTSLAMRRKILTSLKTMMTFAQSRGLLAQNVARAVKVNGDRRTKQGPLRDGVDFPSRSELRAIIDTAPARWRPLLVTAIFTGMRASELRGLRWADIDLMEGIIHVRQRADAWMTLGPTKSEAGKRDIPLAPMVINALTALKDAPRKGDLDLVFPNGRGNVESIQNIWKRCWTPVQIECGLLAGTSPERGRYNFHSLRHAAASLFIAHLNWTPKRVQVVMGHSSIQMTFDLYGHLYEDKDADREAMKKVEAAIAAA
jgi:integrase